MGITRGCLLLIGGIVVLLLVMLGVSYCLLSLSPPLKAEMTPVLMTAEAVQRFDQKVETFVAEIEAAVAEGQEKQVSLVISEEEANSKLVDILAEGDMPLENVLINFLEGEFLACGIADIPGIDVQVAVRGRVEMMENGPKVVTEDVNLGRLPLSQGMRNGIINSLLDFWVEPDEIETGLSDLPWQITDIQITDGQLAIVGETTKL